ncbi:MAG: hypothetical protein E4G99_05655, partial [Anaerolineales bacterium]
MDLASSYGLTFEMDTHIDQDHMVLHAHSRNSTVHKLVLRGDKSGGGKTHYGRLRKQSNQYLKWAFIEAANVVVRQRRHPNWRTKHVTILY